MYREWPRLHFSESLYWCSHPVDSKWSEDTSFILMKCNGINTYTEQFTLQRVIIQFSQALAIVRFEGLSGLVHILRVVDGPIIENEYTTFVLLELEREFEGTVSQEWREDLIEPRNPSLAKVLSERVYLQRRFHSVETAFPMLYVSGLGCLGCTHRTKVMFASRQRESLRCVCVCVWNITTN